MPDDSRREPVDAPRRPREQLGTHPARDLAGEVREELEFHLASHAEDLVRQGWSEADARAEARRRFGDVEGVQRVLLRVERRRERMTTRQGLLGGLRQDLAFAVRQTRRAPGFAAATVAVIALGVGVATAVFSVADAALLRPLPFPDAGRLVALHDVQDGPGFPPSLPEFRDWRREGTFLEASAAFARFNHTLHLGDVPERVLVGWVEGDLEGVSGLRPLAGRSFTAAEASTVERVLLLDEDYWRSRFAADAGVVGRTMTLDGEPATVVGVLPREVKLLFDAPDVSVWRPLPDLPMFTRGLHLLHVVARLREGVALEEAAARAEAMAEALRESGVTGHGIALGALREALVGDTRRVVLVLASAVALMLLIASANLTHLSLARAWSRARELAVRGALGAGRGRLARQLLTESALLGLTGGIAGLLLARWITGFVAAATGRAAVEALASATEPRTVAFALLASGGVGLLFGWVPARRAGELDAGRALREGSRIAPLRRGRARHALVAAEVALSAVLLTGGGLLVRTVARLLDQDPGFSTSGVLTAQIVLPGGRYPGPEERARFWDELLGRLGSLAGVEGAGLVSQLPLTGDTHGTFEIVGEEFPDDGRPQAKKRFAGPGYFETMGIPVLRGRAFLPTDRMGEPEVAVVSRALAERYWPGVDPVGRRIRFLWQTDAEQEIVGVVGDVRSDALDRAGEGTIYLSHAQIGPAGLAVVLRAVGHDAPSGDALRGLVLEIDPAQPLHSISSLEALVRRSVSDRTTIMVLLGSLAALALLLAAVGAYAVASQSVSGRTREIGVRMAVGAEPGRIVLGLLLEELLPVAAGLAVGLAAAVALAPALGAWLYGVPARDPLTLGVVVLVLGGSAAAASIVPTLRALRVSPSRVLRQE